jgi:hypothetical protein
LFYGAPLRKEAGLSLFRRAALVPALIRFAVLVGVLAVAVGLVAVVVLCGGWGLVVAILVLVFLFFWLAES